MGGGGGELLEGHSTSRCVWGGGSGGAASGDGRGGAGALWVWVLGRWQWGEGEGCALLLWLLLWLLLRQCGQGRAPASMRLQMGLTQCSHPPYILLLLLHHLLLTCPCLRDAIHGDKKGHATPRGTPGQCRRRMLRSGARARGLLPLPCSLE